MVGKQIALTVTAIHQMITLAVTRASHRSNK